MPWDFLNPATWSFDQLVGGIIDSIANTLSEAYIWVITQVMDLLLHSPYPAPDSFGTDPVNALFLVGLGGTTGLARLLIGVVAVIIIFVAVLTPLRDHSMRFSRALTSVLVVAVFAFAFFPIYAIAYDLSVTATQAGLNLLTGTEGTTSEDVAALMRQDQENADVFAIFRIIVFVVGCIFALVILIEVAVMVVLFYIALFMYPIAWAVRPLGNLFTMGVHILHGAIGTSLLAPAFMILGFVMPIVLPLHENALFQLIYTLVGGAIAVFMPFVLFCLFYMGSSKIIGTTDSTIKGAVDINSIPPLNTKEMQESIEDSSTSGFKTFASSFAPAAAGALLSKGDTRSKLREAAVDAAGIALTATGHPHVATAINMADSYQRDRQERKKAEAQAWMDDKIAKEQEAQEAQEEEADKQADSENESR